MAGPHRRGQRQCGRRCTPWLRAEGQHASLDRAALIVPTSMALDARSLICCVVGTSSQDIDAVHAKSRWDLGRWPARSTPSVSYRSNGHPQVARAFSIDQEIRRHQGLGRIPCVEIGAKDGTRVPRRWPWRRRARSGGGAAGGRRNGHGRYITGRSYERRRPSSRNATDIGQRAACKPLPPSD